MDHDDAVQPPEQAGSQPYGQGGRSGSAGDPYENQGQDSGGQSYAGSDQPPGSGRAPHQGSGSAPDEGSSGQRSSEGSPTQQPYEGPPRAQSPGRYGSAQQPNPQSSEGHGSAQQSAQQPYDQGAAGQQPTGPMPSPWARQSGSQQHYGGSGQAGYYGPYSTGSYPAQQTQPLTYTQLSSKNDGNRRHLVPVAVAVLVAAIVGGGAGAAIEHSWGGSGGKTVVSSLANPPAKNTSAQKPSNGSVQKVAQQVLPSVVSITVSQGDGSGDEGTGIILSSDGEILTNNHVISSAAGGQGSISVTFNDGKTVDASILGRDTVTDLAVIKAKNVTGAQPATLGSSGALQVGQPVVAIGSPLGLSGTVTTGIVSALNRPVNTSDSGSGGGQDPNQQLPPGFPGNGNGNGNGNNNQAVQATVIDAIQTDAAINPGNSGGALVNMDGQVVGINQSIASLGGSSSSGSQSGSIGLGFAIPINEARPIVDQLIKNGKATHAQIGVGVVSASNNNGVPIGAQLRSVNPGEAGAKAGLKAGDVITKLNDREIDSDDALIAAVRSHRPGDTVTVTYTRSGHTHTTRVTLGSDS